MARKSLRPQLNQIRAWVRQGRTDAWIAHQLEVSASQLSEFRRRHGLSAEGEASASGEVDLRDEIEAEIEAAEAERPDEPEPDEGETEDKDEEKPPRRRRRRRRGGRGRRKRPGAGMEATLEEQRGSLVVKLDKKLKDDPIYSEHWEGHKDLRLTVEPDRIVVERAQDDGKDGEPKDDDKGDEKGDEPKGDDKGDEPEGDDKGD